MSAGSKFVTLLNSLLELTVDGKLEWDEGFEPESFRIVKNYALIEVGRDGPQLGYYARLEDKMGRTLQILSQDDDGTLNLSLLQNLYDAAERSFLAQGDKLIDRMMSDFSRIS